MSPSRSERRELRKLEAGISRSDPHLARLLDGFNGLATGQAMFPVQRRYGAVAAAWTVSAARHAGRGGVAAAAAVFAPGVRERLGVRMPPQPMARAPGQRLT